MATYLSPKEAATAVTLRPGASAEHDTCGSCKFFKRADASSYPCNQDRGWCRFVLPPLMQKYVEKEYTEADSDWGPRTRMDTERCDCWMSDGRTYIVQRLILPKKT